MPTPIISICIPTYNRASFLETCIKSITDQFVDHLLLDQIEIVISDNASTDNTCDIVKTYTDKFPNQIQYFRNEQNIGFDRNLLNVVSRSKGIYCLTFGDDDAFIPGCFRLLLDKINQYSAPYFMLNCWGYDNRLEKPVQSKPNRLIKEDMFYPHLSDFVINIESYLDIVGYFGGMSVQLFKKEYWSRCTEKEHFIGTQTVHLFILLSVFKNLPFVLLSEPMVKTRNDNMRWDTYPGLETHRKRAEKTIDAALWISDQYHLNLNRKNVTQALFRRAYIIYIKEAIKKVLYVLHIRR